MPNVYKIVIFKALGGRAGAEAQWTNNYHILSDDPINAASIEAAVTRLVNFEKGFHFGDVNFMRASATLVGDEEGGVPKGVVRVFDLQGVGAYGALPAGGIQPLAMTLRLKFGTDGGRGKQNFYRGALSEAFVNSDGSGDPRAIIDPGVYGGTSPQAFTTAIGAGSGAPLVVVSKSKDNPVPEVNEVESINVAGVSFRKRRVKRKAKNVSDENSFLEAILEIGKELAPLVIFMLSKGKTLSPAARTPLKLATTELGSSITTLSSLLDG